MSQRLTREERQQTTRTHLLDAAGIVFSRRGYHAATVDEIAETAGFSKGAVYSNFTSKEELFLALLDRHYEREIATWGKPCAEGAPQQTFVEVIRRDRAWNLLQVEFMLYAIREEAVRPQLAERLRTIYQPLRDHLAALCTAEGKQPILPLDHLPWIINALGIGLSLLVYLDGESLPPNLYEAAFDQLFR